MERYRRRFNWLHGSIGRMFLRLVDLAFRTMAYIFLSSRGKRFVKVLRGPLELPVGLWEYS